MTVSLGPKKITLVDLIGVEARAAKLKLESQGFFCFRWTMRLSDTVAEDMSSAWTRSRTLSLWRTTL